jgi:hypothetical protein
MRTLFMIALVLLAVSAMCVAQADVFGRRFKNLRQYKSKFHYGKRFTPREAELSDSSLDIDANKVLDQVATAFKWRPSSYTRKEIDGGIWVTAVEDGKILSAFWHPTKAHKTSVIGKVEVRGDWVPAGQTAISIGNSALFGNKAYYDIKSN